MLDAAETKRLFNRQQERIMVIRCRIRKMGPGMIGDNQRCAVAAAVIRERLRSDAFDHKQFANGLKRSTPGQVRRAKRHIIIRVGAAGRLAAGRTRRSPASGRTGRCAAGRLPQLWIVVCYVAIHAFTPEPPPLLA